MNLDLPEKLYYSIGEIAEAFGVKTSLLRFWEKEFELLKPKKNLKKPEVNTLISSKEIFKKTFITTPEKEAISAKTIALTLSVIT